MCSRAFRYEGEESAIKTCKNLHVLPQASAITTHTRTHTYYLFCKPTGMCNCKVRISVATAQTLVLILDDAVATVGSLSEFVLMFSNPSVSRC